MIQKIKNNKWEVITITLICVLALFLNIWRISIQGYANEYYTAGVESMTQSWKNFFFVAYDPAGYVSIDKPPLGLWLQAISAKMFGVSGFSVLLPEILGAVISVFLLYKILKKAVNWKIATLGAFFLAITPIFVATARTNTPDMVMIPLLLWALLATITAIEKQKLRYLIGVAVIIGLAFNVKMLQAYMVVPAAFGAYLLFTNIRLRKRLCNIFIALIVMASVSLSWATVVDLTPKTERPYVGSTTSNSAMELIFGWNGISRLTSTGNTNGKSNDGNVQQGQISGEMPPPNMPSDGNQTIPQQGQNGMKPPGGKAGASGTPMTPGTPGVSRLFQSGLGEQVSWFLGLAISGFFLVLFQFKKKQLKTSTLVDGDENTNQDDKKEETSDVQRVNRFGEVSKVKQNAVLWMLWLLPGCLYFSFSTGLFHTYYLSMLAAPIAALAALGLSVIFFTDSIQRPIIVWIGLVAIICNSFLQSIFHAYAGDWETWMIVLIPLVTILGVIIYIVCLTLRPQKMLKRLSIGIILVGMTMAPLAWSFTPMLYGEDAALAQATPGTSISSTQRNQISDTTKKLAAYLESNQGDALYLVAAQSSHEISSIIIATGKPAMATGGFGGGDNTLTLSEFRELVKAGKVQYYLAGEQSRSGSDEIATWVKANSTVIEAREYGVVKTDSQFPGKDQMGPKSQIGTLYKINSNVV